MHKFFAFVSFTDVFFLITKDPTAIELGYAGRSRSTLVVETNEYVEIMDEDVAESPVRENVAPHQGNVRAQALSSSQEEGMCPPNVRMALEFKNFKGLSKRISSRGLSLKQQKGRRLFFRKIY